MSVEIPDFMRRAIEAQGKISPDEVLERLDSVDDEPEPEPQQAELELEPPAQESLLPDPTTDRIGKFQRPGDAAETQRSAALGVYPRTGTARWLVLQFITQQPDGATDEEVQIALKMNPSTQRPRRVELVEDGWIEDSGSRRETLASNQEAVVWVLTEAGRSSIA